MVRYSSAGAWTRIFMPGAVRGYHLDAAQSLCQERLGRRIRWPPVGDDMEVLALT